MRFSKEVDMYVAMVLLLMFALPLVSVLVETLVLGSAPAIIPLLGRWFVFWSVGVRAFSAGLHQSLRPEFTARRLLGIQAVDSLQIVQELGFANTALGLIGILSLLHEDWVRPTAIAGCVFLGLAVSGTSSAETAPLSKT
jgi:hypothetical protein